MILYATFYKNGTILYKYDYSSVKSRKEEIRTIREACNILKSGKACASHRNNVRQLFVTVMQHFQITKLF